MSNNIWKKYKKKEILSQSYYSIIYKVKKIDTGNYYAIEEINMDKYKKYTNNYFIEFSAKKQENNNYMKITETFTENKYFYIVMELFLCNLKEYLNEREPFTINEVEIILNQLKTNLKNMINIKLSNIFISINKIDEINFKIINYEKNNSTSNSNIKNNKFKELGMELFYMLKKEYPLDENNKYDNKIIEKSFKTDEIEIKDLLKRLLDPNINFTWDDYQYHSFLNSNINSNNKMNSIIPKFNLLCKRHNKIIDAYCENCQTNICIDCFTDSHLSDHVIPFSKIGINDDEMENLQKEITNIEKNINLLNEVKNKINNLFVEINKVNQNRNIYKNNPKKDFKKFYIEYLNNMNKFIENEIKINMIPLDFSYIICDYKNKINIKKPCEILNCYENAKKDSKILEGENNEEEISKNCDLYLNNKKIDFTFSYHFEIKQNYNIKIIVKKSLINLNYLFHSCAFLKLIDLSNFNTNEVINMNRMFNFCSGLTELNLESFNTEKVTNMCRMFSNCSNLNKIHLNNFNTSNTIDMSEMFAKCNHLKNLDLSSFNTENVQNMSEMFCDCTLLEKINLSTFDTSKVTNMSKMFCNCKSLIELNLENFDVNKVTNMKNMFENISNNCNLKITNNKLKNQYLNRDLE